MTASKPDDDEPPQAAASFDVGAADALDRMIDLFGRHGDTYRMYVPARRTYTYVIHHPDDVKRVLVTNYRNYVKGADRDRIKILLGLGLMTSEGVDWRRHHDMMQPFFHRRIIARFAEAIAAANDRFLLRLDAELGSGKPLDVTAAMSELTLEIVLSAIFGSDLAQVAEPFAIVTQDSSRNLEFVYKFRALRTLVSRLITRRQEDKEEHADYLGLLMQARDKATREAMSAREVIDEILTLVVAGHETTASVLNLTWYLLSRHPRIESRLYEELGPLADVRAPAPACVEELGYTQQVLNEVMRLYPPGWLLSRRTVGPDVLGGYAVPAGANVLIPLYLLHRHPRYWSDPERFDPDRFAADRVAERPRYAFVPFSAGPRHCIGETLAMFEMLMHLCKIVPRYRLIHVPDRPLELEAQINLRTHHPLMMRIERRGRSA
jgi:enediyne biosynthesis protein E7